MHTPQKFRSLIRLLYKAFGQYKKRMFLLSGLGLLSGVFEGIGVNAIIPLLSIVLGESSGTKDGISIAIENFFQFLHIPFTLKFLVIFISILFILKALVLIVSNYIKICIIEDFKEKARGTLFTEVVCAKWPYLKKQKLGHLETILMVDVEQSAALLQGITESSMLITGLIIYTLVAVNISLNITIITLILGCIIFFLFKPLLKRTRKESRKLVELNRKIAHHVSQHILGMKTVKSMVVSLPIAKIAQSYFKKLKRVRVRVAFLNNLTTGLIQPIGFLFMIAVFTYSYKYQDFNFAALLAIIYLIQKIFTYVQQAQRMLGRVNEYAPNVQSFIDTKEGAKISREVEGGKEVFTFKKDISFTSVQFSYENRGAVLDNINLSIKKGEMVGIVGPSGSGKTTMVDLLLRLIEPTKGEITVDGKPISDISPKAWRNSVGYVSQDIFLLNDSIKNNIIFYDDSVDDKLIKDAAQMANIHDFIVSCENGYDTIIGDRGIFLSAGQRQRMVIARILARNPNILVLDEATSALDNKSEEKIQNVIENLKGKITVFVIAHRLSTVLDCDRLITISDGKIIESGKPRELLEDRDSYFYKTYNLKNI